MHYFIAFMYATHIRSHIIPWTVGIRRRISSNLHACPIAKYSFFCIWTSYIYALQAVEHLNLQKSHCGICTANGARNPGMSWTDGDSRWWLESPGCITGQLVVAPERAAIHDCDTSHRCSKCPTDRST